MKVSIGGKSDETFLKHISPPFLSLLGSVSGKKDSLAGFGFLGRGFPSLPFSGCVVRGGLEERRLRRRP